MCCYSCTRAGARGRWKGPSPPLILMPRGTGTQVCRAPYLLFSTDLGVRLGSWPRTFLEKRDCAATPKHLFAAAVVVVANSDVVATAETVFLRLQFKVCHPLELLLDPH